MLATQVIIFQKPKKIHIVQMLILKAVQTTMAHTTNALATELHIHLMHVQPAQHLSQAVQTPQAHTSNVHAIITMDITQKVQN